MAREIIVKSPSTEYVIKTKLGKEDARIAATAQYNLYICTSASRSEQELLLKVAASAEDNGVLDREAFLLRSMRTEALRLETEYAALKGEGTFLNYQLGFPEVMETFLSEQQGGRRVLVLGFGVADDLGKLVPIAHVRTRDCVRVDPKTSAWIMGKTLKILVFAHSQGISVGNLSGENILIERDWHCVTLLDWSAAMFHTDEVPQDIACKEISRAAQEVIILLGGDPATGKIPDDDQITDGCYAGILRSLVCGNYNNASRAHHEFYELVEILWGRKYHPYTSYPLD
jgi:hypothetical protein